MTEGTVSQVFYTVEMKLNSYLVLIEKGVDFSKEHRSWLFRSPDLDYVDSAAPLLDKKQMQQHIEALLEKLDNILWNNRGLKTLGQIAFEEMQFGTLDNYVAEFREELTTIRTRLTHCLNLYCPDVPSTNVPQVSQKPELGDTKYSFSSSIFTALARMSINDDNIFDYVIEQDDSFQVVKSNVQAFLNGQFDSIVGTLDFKVCEKQIGYLIIHYLATHSRIELSDIKNISINGIAFDAKNCSTALSKLRDKRRKELLSMQTVAIIDDVENLLLVHLK
jgi:hypothetical protein